MTHPSSGRPVDDTAHAHDAEILSARWPTLHSQDYEANRLLRLAPAAEYERLAPHLETVRLTRRQLLYGPNEPIRYVYFPQTGVLSAISHLHENRAVEVGTIGNEGMLGLPVFLMSDRAPLEAVVHVPGVAKRVSADTFRELLHDCSEFHMVLHRYTLAFLTQVAQSAACNRVHSITERCARWLLMTHDRMQTDRFPLTQDLLAIMLGARRPGVSIAAAGLQSLGLIQYTRGRIAITDRKGLENAACECYGIVRQHLDRVLPPDAQPATPPASS
ncbi:MAG: transcriptional regulator, Crp/Fnr family [Gemmatimonadetes bacterium]|nr:transcriptional regulator, Crp/Fnr family [Gemmatimonadota bacterium]